MVAVDELVLGAVLGAVVTELVLLAKAVITEAATFKNRVEDLRSDLRILSKLNELDSCTQKHEAENLIKRGWKLEEECSTVCLLNLFKIKCCASKLNELKSSISKKAKSIDSLVLHTILIKLKQAESTDSVGSPLASDQTENSAEIEVLQTEEPAFVSAIVKSDSEEAANKKEAPEAGEMRKKPMDDRARFPPPRGCIKNPVISSIKFCSNEDTSESFGDPLGGASVGTLVSELYGMVEGAITKSSMFNTQLKQLKSTLESITRFSSEIDMLTRDMEMKKWIEILKRVKQLLNKCSTVNIWNWPQRYRYAAKLVELDESMLRFSQLVIQLQMIGESKEIMEEIRVILGR